MRIPEILKSLFRRSSIDAAAQLPTPQTPKVQGRQRTYPSYLTTAKPSTETQLVRKDRNLANTNLLDYRSAIDSRQVIHDFVRSNPDLSAAVTAYARTAITRKFTAVAKNPDGSFNADASVAVQQLITRMDILPDYSIGYDDGLSIRANSEVFSSELLQYGRCCAELVLDKARMPDKIVPISSTQILLYPSSDGRRVIPHQKIGDAEVELDYPTFFMVELDKDLLEAHPVSPIESAIQAVLFNVELMNDIRRIVRKAIHPRVVVTLDEEKIRKGMPQELQYDAEGAKEYMEGVIASVESRVNGLSPEDALVLFDSVGIDVVDHGNTALNQEYNVLQEMINAKLSTGAKVLPTVLGHSNGTSNTASAEVLMFVKSVEGAVWGKLNEMYSKMFTLAVRLLGHDVYVEFSYDPIDLRPDNELEAFRAMKQSRVLELLSLGLISDEEACVQLTGHLPPPGHKPLSGSGFRPNTSLTPAGDGYNGASNSGSTMNQNLNSDAPKNPKSQNGGKPGQ